MTAGLDLKRLGKVLALLSSPMDGEALAAARMLVKLLSDAGMRPEELAARRVPAPKPPTVRDLGIVEVRKLVADLLASIPMNDDQIFLVYLGRQLRSAPHIALTLAQVRRVNRLWREAREQGQRL